VLLVASNAASAWLSGRQVFSNRGDARSKREVAIIMLATSCKSSLVKHLQLIARCFNMNRTF
jgi:hypothetical protein